MNKIALFLFSIITLANASNSFGNTEARERLIKQAIKENTSKTSVVSVKNLMWKKCSEGQIWTGLTCSGNASKYQWKNALNYAKNANYNGFNDWRVPTIKELYSLVYCSNNKKNELNSNQIINYQKICSGQDPYKKPTINQALFPNTPLMVFWSSSVAGGINNAWYVFFNNGYGNSSRSNSFGIRLVRSIK